MCFFLVVNTITYMSSDARTKRRKGLPEAITRRKETICSKAPVSTYVTSKDDEYIYRLRETCKKNERQSSRERARKLPTKRQQISGLLQSILQNDPNTQHHSILKTLNFSTMYKNSTDSDDNEELLSTMTCLLDAFEFMTDPTNVDAYPLIKDRMESFLMQWYSHMQGDYRQADPQTTNIIKKYIVQLISRSL